MASKPQTTPVRATDADIARMDRIAPKLERRNRGAKFKRPGVITKALDALERELAGPAKAATETPAT